MGAYLQRLFEALERGRRFVTHDVWRIGRPGEPIPHGFIIKQIRVVILLVRSLMEDTLLLRAAALTFATMLSVIPFLAVVFFVIQTLDLDEQLDKAVHEWIGKVRPAASATGPDESLSAAREPAAPDEGAVGPASPGRKDLAGNGVLGERIRSHLPGTFSEEEPNGAYFNPVTWVLDSAEANADPKKLGLAGMIFILTTALGLIWNIESSFNAIWGVRTSRSWYRMFSDYVMVLLLLPILVAGVLSVSAALQSPVVMGRLGPFASLLRGTQYLVIWTAFAALYFVVPNTRVRFRYALLGGVVAGTLWVWLSGAYISSQVMVSRYGVIYSTFALFPLFLMWIYFSWMLVLFGAELTFAYQNEKTFAMERLAAGASHAYREALGLRAMLEVSHRFDGGQGAFEPAAAAEQWGVPTRLLNETLATLEDTGLVRRCAMEPVTYQPGRSIDKIRVCDVVAALRLAGRDPSALRQDPALAPLLAAINGVGDERTDASLAAVLPQVYAPKQVAPVEEPVEADPDAPRALPHAGDQDEDHG